MFSWQLPSPAVRQVSRHFEVVTATTSASANEVQMNASHASRARSSEEVDMRLLRLRRGTESVAANVRRRCWARWAAWRRPLRCAGRRHVNCRPRYLGEVLRAASRNMPAKGQYRPRREDDTL
eukprot:scaffold103404_cov54-Phaeocystis_antarctica.AAC.1